MLETAATGRMLVRIRSVGIFYKFLFAADRIDFVQRQCFVLRFQEMAIAPQHAPRLDRTLLMQRCEHAIGNAVERTNQAPERCWHDNLLSTCKRD
ncbi:hypothetical protein XI06_10465 [Bradyrhizobium sp. CCBAU 11434]|nr:hypothetical protein [Bradyrhizobium sp. CCBAU 11434]